MIRRISSVEIFASVFVLVACFVLSLPVCASAATKYVCNNISTCNANGGSGWSGTPGTLSGCGSKANPCSTMQYAFSQMASGDALIVGNGTYTGASNQFTRTQSPPAGTGMSSMTIVQAEVPGYAMFDGQNARPMIYYTASALGNLPKYLKFQGLVFLNAACDAWGQGNTVANVSSVSSQVPTGDMSTAFDAYYYFKGVGFHSAQSCDTFSITGTRNVLLEDCFSWGNGRYSIHDYVSDRVVVRRHVSRMDVVSQAASYPTANYMNYTGHDTEFQNVIAIDTDSHNWANYQAPFGGIYVRESYSYGGGTRNSEDVAVRGAIVANMDPSASNQWGTNLGGIYTKDYTLNTLFDNSILWKAGGGLWANNLQSTVRVNHMSVGQAGYSGNNTQALGDHSNLLVTNSNAYNATGLSLGAMSSSSAYNNDYNTGGSFSGSSITTANTPYQYIFKPESSFPTGNDGKKVGADVRYAIGRTGSWYGDPGYTALQDGTNGEAKVKLWPWGVSFTGDNSWEKRIREIMRQNYDTSDETRGFAQSNQSITNWVATGAGTLTPVNPLSVDGSGGTSVASVDQYIYDESGTPDLTPPTSPTTLSANATSSSSITITWDAATDNVGVTGYIVERCQGPTTCTNFTQVGTPSASPFVNSGLAANTEYSYHVRATDSAGNLSGWSNVVGATTQTPPPPDTTPPSVPSSLATIASSSTTIDLSWTASTDNVGVTGYKVERCSGNGCTAFAEIGTPTATNYSDTGLSPSSPYRYQVRATDAALNNSAYSAIAQATTQAPLPISASLMLGFNFNEGTGTTTQDVSGHTNTGTLNGGAIWNTTGRNGNSVTLNGTSGYVTVSDNNTLDLTSAMTLSAWIYPTTLSAWRTVLIKEQSGNLAYALYAHNDTNTPSQHVYIGTDQQLNGTASLPVNTWTHLAATYDGTIQRLFVNGVQVSSRAQTGSILTSTGSLRIGGNSIWGEYFAGRIDDVRIYNTALTQQEIQTDMNTPLVQPTQSQSCNTVTTSNFSDAAYNSYGAPFDAFQTATNLIDAKCNSADTHTINLTTGVMGDTTRIVYTKGYWYDAVSTAWRQYSGTCTGALNGEWCQGSVSATITDPNVLTASSANPTYLVGMTCSVQGGGWRCGCRDTNCTNFYWQIQGAGL